MLAILYLYKCKAINWFKESLKKPARLILFLFIFGSMASMLIIPFQDFKSDTSEIPFDVGAIAPLVFWGIGILLLAIGIYSGSKTGSVIFSMPDTQFVFTAPFKPQNVLFYGMLNMLATSLFSLFFIIYQIPNLKNAGLTSKQILLSMLFFVLFIICVNFIQQAVYLFSSTHDGARPWIQKGILVIIGLFAAAILYFFFVHKGSLNEFLELSKNKTLLYSVPFVGWFVQVMLVGFEGISLHFWISLALLLVVTALAIVYSYSVQADFYEDATEATVRRAEILAKQKAGRTTSYVERKRKVRDTGINNGFGENTIFFLHLREQRRLKPFLIGLSMFIYIVMAVALTFMVRNNVISSTIACVIFLGGIVVWMFFSNLDNPLVNDLRQPMFYYIPGSNYKKVIYASISPVVTIALDMIPAVLILIIGAQAPVLLAILMYLCALAFMLVFMSIQLIVFRILGKVDGTLAQLIYFFSGYLIVFPAVGGLIAMTILGNLFSSFWFYIGSVVLIIVLVGLFLLASLAGKSQLDRGLNE